MNFIVRAVDDILKEEFGLAGGLADTSKTKIKTIVRARRLNRRCTRCKFWILLLDRDFSGRDNKHVHKQFEKASRAFGTTMWKNI